MEKDNTVFTEKESEIILLVLKAKSRKMIADDLKITVNTIDRHLQHIHLKTNTHSNSELLRWLIATGYTFAD